MIRLIQDRAMQTLNLTMQMLHQHTEESSQIKHAIESLMCVSAVYWVQSVDTEVEQGEDMPVDMAIRIAETTYEHRDTLVLP